MPTYYNVGGVRIEIRTRENGHNEPHVHIIYAGETMSVSLITGATLSGDMKNNKARKRATDRVKENIKKLRKEWRRYYV